MFARALTCWGCGLSRPPAALAGLCDCGKPLRVDYDLGAAAAEVNPSKLERRARGLWRYRELLPLPASEHPPSLGEGGTPLILADPLAASLGMERGRLFVKDEALNPTGSFKARGMAVAVAMARLGGATRFFVPSAGNAGGALAAYAARYGLEAHVFLPRDAPKMNVLECEALGARVTLVDGLISDCARIGRELARQEGWFDVSTFHEPYRVEGKKTMGLEIAEELGWALPDVVIYPTGGGTGLIGVAKAFNELEELGWVARKRVRFVAVQPEGCAPVTRAFQAGAADVTPIQDASTVAAGLRVPGSIAGSMMLSVLRATNGTAVSVADHELVQAARRLSRSTGIVACPEGGTCLAATEKLIADGWIASNETVVMFNTGSGAKSAEAFEAFPEEALERLGPRPSQGRGPAAAS